MREPIDLGRLLDRALEISDYESKKRAFANQNQTGGSKKGMGIAAFLHGAGFTGSGERYLSSVVGVEGCADGSCASPGVEHGIWSGNEHGAEPDCG